jgi:membrane dipeptidase
MPSGNADALHKESIVIDATCPLMRDKKYIAWYAEGGVTAAAPTVGGFDGAAKSFRDLGVWIRHIQENPKYLLIKAAADIERAKRENRFGLIFHFQGTEPVEDSLDLVDAYKEIGVGMMQLTYNVKNRVGDGCEERTDAGLSRFGLKLIERMNTARMIVDCSHTGYRTTLEAIEASSRPAVFSHANAKAVWASDRNIKDDQIRAIAKSGGVIGVVGFPAFVAQGPRPTLDQFIAHIDYHVKTAGIDHVGLGIDYYDSQAFVMPDDEALRKYNERVASGMWQPTNYPPPPHYYPEGIETPRTLPKLTARLLERGYKPEAVQKIMGGNWLRVFRTVWGN